MKQQLSAQPKRSWLIRWVIVVLISILGLDLLVRAYGLHELEMEWRVIAGMACLSYAVINLLSLIRYPEGFPGLRKRFIVVALFCLAGALCFEVLSSHTVPGQPISPWLKVVLLDSGVDCFFIAAVDLLIGGVRERALEGEREEMALKEELILSTGIAHELSAWQYYAMRDGLEYAIKLGKGRSYKELVALVLDFAEKASVLPERLDITKMPGAMAEIQRELMVTELTTQAAIESNLSDNEYVYLTAVINARSSPNRKLGEPIPEELLPVVVENSVEVLRRRGWRRIFPLDDPLAAKEELAAHFKNMPKKPLRTYGSSSFEGD